MTVPIKRITNSDPFVGNVPLVTGISFFAARLPAIAKAGIMNRNLSNQHVETDGQVVPRRIGVDPGKRAAVIAGTARIGV